MEAAESEYESALLARLAELEKAKAAKETDDLLRGLLDKAGKMLDWTNGKTKDFTEGAKPENLGKTPEETDKKKADLDKFMTSEKPPKEEARRARTPAPAKFGTTPSPPVQHRRSCELGPRSPVL